MVSGIVWAVFFIFFAIFATQATAVERDAALERIRILNSEIHRHNYLYYVLGKPEISNQAYDRLYDELLRLETEFPDLVLPDSPTRTIGSNPDNRLARVYHPVPMLSLKKCHSVEELLAWSAHTAKKTAMDLSFVVEEKIDGAAVELNYRNGVLVTAATRGNGMVGYDVTHHVRNIEAVPRELSQSVSITMRGEVFIKESDFKRLDQTLATSRSISWCLKPWPEKPPKIWTMRMHWFSFRSWDFRPIQPTGCLRIQTRWQPISVR
jgi:DNA ligase (NAD+)